MSITAAPRNLIASYGQVMTIRRRALAAGPNAWTKGAETITYHPARGRARGYKPTELVGGIQAGDQRIALDAASATIEPTITTDEIAVGTFTGDAGADWLRIVSIYSPTVRGGTPLHVLQVRK